MKYSRVYIDALGYELPTQVVTSEEIEDRLLPALKKIRMPAGQLEALTGISERRWWEPGYSLAEGAIAAARQALKESGVRGSDLGVVVYGGITKEFFEPAAACQVAAALGVPEEAAVHDVGNACLGMLNGMVDVANRIELGQVRAGLVVSCESAREVVEAAIEHLLEQPTMENFRTSLATLTGGSGAAAVLLTDGSFGTSRRRLLGGVAHTAPQFNHLCRWGLIASHNPSGSGTNGSKLYVSSSESSRSTERLRHFTSTDATGLLKHGVALGLRTFQSFLNQLGWRREEVDRVICHQVGALHRDTALSEFGLPPERDFPTFPFLGNMATVSLPISAALAEEREFLRPGDRVGLLGIASGLNCLLLGVEW